MKAKSETLRMPDGFSYQMIELTEDERKRSVRLIDIPEGEQVIIEAWEPLPFNPAVAKV